MGYGALMHRRRLCPYCCGGQLWMVTRGFFGCGITEGVVRRLWEPWVMRLDRVWEMWVRLPPSKCWARRRWRLVGSSVLMAWVCGDGRRRMTANAM